MAGTAKHLPLYHLQPSWPWQIWALIAFVGRLLMCFALEELLALCGTLCPSWTSAAVRERCSINDIIGAWGWCSKILWCRKPLCFPYFKLRDLKHWKENVIHFLRLDHMKEHSPVSANTNSNYKCRFYDSYCAAQTDTVVHEVIYKKSEIWK